MSLASREFHSIFAKDVRFTNCDLANLETRSMELHRVEFVNCRMTGLRSTETEARDLLVQEGDQRYSVLRYGKFFNTEFDQCNLEEADLLGSDLSGTIFRKCNLRNAEFNKVKLVNADLRGSEIEGLRLAAPDVKGATVDLSQAMQLARLLGIRIL